PGHLGGRDRRPRGPAFPGRAGRGRLRLTLQRLERELGVTGFKITAATMAATLWATGAAQACDLKAPDAARAGKGCAQAWMDRNLRLDDILTMGTHNSYHVRTPDKIMALIRSAAPKTWQGLDYGHPPLREQLDDGARALELDLVYDPEGGRFAHPAGARIAGLPEDPAYALAMS